VVNLIEDPSLVIVNSIVLNCLVGEILSESVDDFNLVEFDHNSTLGSTGDVVNFICLNGYLH